jgi:hypothetical protein
MDEEELRKWQEWQKQNKKGLLILTQPDQPTCQACLSLETFYQRNLFTELEGEIGS